MAIPWLIGGAVVAAAVTAVSSNSNRGSSGAGGSGEGEDRRLRSQRERENLRVNKAQFQAYAERVISNFANKYGGKGSGKLKRALTPKFFLSVVDQKIKQDDALLSIADGLSQRKMAVEDLCRKIRELEDAMASLEVLDNEFK